MSLSIPTFGCGLSQVSLVWNELFVPKTYFSFEMSLTMTWNLNKYEVVVLDLVDFRVGIPSVPRSPSSSPWGISALSVMVVVSPSSSGKSIVFSYHSSSTLTVPSYTSSHGIRYSRIPCDTTVVFSIPDSVIWYGKRSSRNQRQSYLLAGSLSRMPSWNCTRKNVHGLLASPLGAKACLNAANSPLLLRYKAHATWKTSRWDIRDFGVGFTFVRALVARPVFC